MLSNLFNDALEKFKKEYKPRCTVADLPESSEIIRNQIPEQLRSFVNSSNFIVSGSVGMGNATQFPWVFLSNRKITKSATKGFYLVYLFKKDMSGFYLSLGVGVTHFLETQLKPIQMIETIINDMRSKISYSDFDKVVLNLGATRQQQKQYGYQIGSIVSKYYAKGQFLDEDLEADLKKMIQIYDSLVDVIGIDFEKYSLDLLLSKGLIETSSKENSLINRLNLIEKDGYLTTDFDYGISEWVELLLDKSVFKKDDLNLYIKWSKFKNNEISAKQFGDLEKKDLAFYRNKVVAVGARISKLKELIVFDDKRSEILWPITMDGKYEKHNEGEVFVWKVKPNLVQAIQQLISNGKIKLEEEKNDETLVLKGTNLIIYGVPGSGKSFHLDRNILVNEKNIIRTTFYPDYTNSDFIGQIMPFSEKDANNNSIIKYQFKPGPFTIALTKAFKFPQEKISLVIEELNRGNASAIFGDLFQLLDRNENGKSEYPITNQFLIDYLDQNEIKVSTIEIPNNLFLYATMNTSDQNVFVLDNAFKRRWDMFHIPTNPNSNHTYLDYFIPKTNITWERFLRIINDEIILTTQNEISSEDKQIGAYFIKKSDLSETENNLDELLARRFGNKMLNYLWTDIARFELRNRWFNSEINSFDQLLERYLAGETIFSEELEEKLKLNE